ncbi:MAG: hemolysin family protein [Deinococcota bacterium]|nr:hemolysin family protein [Deinococcota bacterium]
MTDYLVPIVVILLLVAVNGLFVAAEFAIVGVRHSRITELAEEGLGTARALKRILDKQENLDRYIAVAQLGITLASIGLGMYGERSVAAWLYGPLEHYGGLGYAASHLVGTIVAVSLLTYMHVVFGEMIPKALALHAPEGTSFKVAGLMLLFSRVFHPAVLVLNTISNALLRLLKIPISDPMGRLYSPQELELLVAESHEGGSLGDEQRALIQNIFDFGERTAQQVMVPRRSVVAIEIDSSPAAIWELLRTEGYSRLPVYEGNLDHVIGILHIKSFIRQQLTEPESLVLNNLLRKPLHVLEQMPAEEVLDLLKRNKNHMAVVVDESGGTAGIVTLEDLLEEVVGPLGDEFDRDEPDIERLGDGSLRVKGEVLIEELNDTYGTALHSAHVETVAGLILEALGRPARAGDAATMAGVELVVEEVEGLAIKRLHLKLLASGSVGRGSH